MWSVNGISIDMGESLYVVRVPPHFSIESRCKSSPPFVLPLVVTSPHGSISILVIDV
jgi:hypothetical protein